MKLAPILLAGLIACNSSTSTESEAPTQTDSRLVSKEVSYNADSITMKGYLAYDDALEGRRPGVIVVHEWWGLNDHARNSATKLAEQGYVALAVDMYGDGQVAEHPNDAGAFAGAVNKDFDGARDRFDAAVELLKSDDRCSENDIAAIGYCFGGGIVLNMARQGADLDAVASFHGSLNPIEPATEGSVEAKVLVMNGADDSFVSQEAIDAFKKEMETANVDYEFINYPGAVHGFTNPSADEAAEEFGMNVGYNREADEQSWARLLQFLSQTFGR